MSKIVCIAQLHVLPTYQLLLVFDDGRMMIFDVEEDINSLATYESLRSHPDFFSQAHLDTSRTCVEWTVEIDLPSDTIYEHGIELMPARTERDAG